MLLENLFPTGRYGLNEDTFSVRSGMFDTVVATRSAGVWSLTAAGSALLAGNISTDVAPSIGTAGTKNGATVSVKEYGLGEIVHRTVLTLNALPQTIVNTTAEYAGTLLYTFPKGRILLLGATASLAQTTTSALATTIASGTAGAFALGSAAASAISLTGTMVDMLPSTAFTSSTVINVAGAAVKGQLAASAQFDGNTTPQPVYLNSAIATGTADGTQTFSGTVNLVWVNLGDY